MSPTPKGLTFLLLLQAVVAGLAQAVQIALIPEQRLVAVVRRLVVCHELRCVSLDATASLHLASEEITDQNAHAQLLPTSRLIPGSPWLRAVTLTMALRFRFLPTLRRGNA
ncbi:hypothetical protein [Rhizobium sp.]|uniref:hypothetical protein n=1 Tax=Rhizobium sp. TaxID=391 RepID=UPI0034C6B24C